jgi:hypothetical protein
LPCHHAISCASPDRPMVCSRTILHARKLTAPHCFVNRHVRRCGWPARISCTVTGADPILAALNWYPAQ